MNGSISKPRTPKPRNPGLQKAATQERNKRMFGLLAETFQALGDGSRIRIIWALSHGELPVGELARIIGMSQPAVSQHLRTLRNLKLLRARREGRSICYALDDEHIERLLGEGIRHVEDFL